MLIWSENVRADFSFFVLVQLWDGKLIQPSISFHFPKRLHLPVLQDSGYRFVIVVPGWGTDAMTFSGRSGSRQKLNEEGKLGTQKKTCFQIIVKVFLHNLPCRIQNNTFYLCSSRPAKNQHGIRNPPDLKSLSDMFSSACLQTLSVSWWVCLSTPPSIISSILFVCIKHWHIFPWCKNHLQWYDTDSCEWLHPIRIVSGRITGDKRADEFFLRISLWKCGRAYYLHENVNSALKGWNVGATSCLLESTKSQVPHWADELWFEMEVTQTFLPCSIWLNCQHSIHACCPCMNMIHSPI